MKFSRNPKSGALEIYTDEGIYIGQMATMGDLLKEKTAQDEYADDGGPGSGNWGHKGRPGKVGGSGKGGGKQYRGGRSDIAFTGSRRDWLNGLSGERQHEAQQFMKGIQNKITAAKKIRGLREKGLITEEELKEALKKNDCDKVDVNASAEENIMKNGDMKERSKLVSFLSEVRDWNSHKDKLIDENLDEDEQKIIKYMEEHITELDDDGLNSYLDLRAKAMDIPNSGKEIPDEIQYRAGTKERPKPPEPEGPDLSFLDKPRGWNEDLIEQYMVSALGETPSYAHKYTKEEFLDISKRFLDRMKYGSPGIKEVRDYGLRAMQAIRSLVTKEIKESGGYKISTNKDFNYGPEAYKNLTDEEKERLLHIANVFDDQFSFMGSSDVNDIDIDSIRRIEGNFRLASLRSKEERKMLQDYILIQSKLLTGMTPSDTDTVVEQKNEEEKKKAAEAKAQADQRKKEQQDFQNSDGAKEKAEIQKRIKEFDPNKAVNSSGNVDAQSVVDAFNKTGIFAEGFKMEKFLDDTDSIKDVTNAFTKVINQFPFLAGDLGGLGGKTDSSNSYGDCSMDAYRGGGEININSAKFEDRQAANARRKSEEKLGFKAKTDDNVSAITATTTHEIGHAIDNWLNRVVNGGLFPHKIRKTGYWEIKEFYSGVSPLIMKKTLSALKMKKADIKDNVSQYATTSPAEFFAECFCECMCSSSPRPVAKEFMNQLNKFIKENNIGDTFTSDLPSMVPKF